eukprot:GEMP01112709.1.p1 GENE.GEMP01112709.1~~GEMP01112709.1.p1  ORF type:complete len:145 (+),score=25.52 GEMP01112709.1:171-605(+)
MSVLTMCMLGVAIASGMSLQPSAQFAPNLEKPGSANITMTTAQPVMPTEMSQLKENLPALIGLPAEDVTVTATTTKTKTLISIANLSSSQYADLEEALLSQESKIGMSSALTRILGRPVEVIDMAISNGATDLLRGDAFISEDI